jgi:PIN domain nuclease of toxin-antitoxin system
VYSYRSVISGTAPCLYIDTHALIWLDQDDPALGPVARQRVEAARKDNCLAVSAISFWEVAMLAAKNRIVEDASLLRTIEAPAVDCIEEIPIKFPADTCTLSECQ